MIINRALFTFACFFTPWVDIVRHEAFEPVYCPILVR